MASTAGLLGTRRSRQVNRSAQYFLPQYLIASRAVGPESGDPETRILSRVVEATFAARVRKGNRAAVTQVSITAGGTGLWGNFHALPIGLVPATPQEPGEFFDPTRGDDEILKVAAPIV